MQYKLIRFAPSNCAEKIYLQKEGYLYALENEQCSIISTWKEVRNEIITKQTNGPWNISYNYTGNYYPGGVFWVQVKGKSILLSFDFAVKYHSQVFQLFLFCKMIQFVK